MPTSPNERIFLELVEVIAIHDHQIAQFGGSPGLRDPGQLEAALFRPQSGYYADVFEEAAALWESLSQNHAFIDGNFFYHLTILSFSYDIANLIIKNQ